jgi:alpha-D-ribose 1-methylphosphonate 5-triphosphate synthase subunit PhnH
VTFAAPLGLLALLAVVPVVAAYFLRRKQPPRVVSALFLWRSRDQRAEAGPRFERFSRELSLLLEALAIVAAALFLADARCGESQSRAHVIVVIDGSLSMRAVSDGTSAADRAKSLVAQLAREEGASALTLIETGLKPRLLAGPQLEVARALSALESWTPSQPTHDVTPAVRLAKELSSQPGQRIFFVTDGPPGAIALPAEVEGRSVGKRLTNLAFLSAQRRDEGGVATVTVRVGSFSDAEASVKVRFTASDAPPQEPTVTVAAGATAVVRVGVRTAGAIDVRLPDDALTDDGALTLLPSPVTTLQVGLLEGLDAASSTAVTRALSVIEQVAFDGTPELTVGPIGSSASVRLGATEPLQSFVGPFFAQKTSAVLDDVQLGGVVWTAGTTSPPGQPLLSAGPVVLASEDDDGVVHLNLELSRSNVQRSLAWPVLWGNLTRRARTLRQGFPRRLVHVGEDVAVVTTAGPSWRLDGPQGVSRPVLGVGALSVPALAPPGTWKLMADGAEVDRLEVVALDAAESDLRTRGEWSVEAARTSALATFASARPRAWAFIAVVLALLLLDFWLTTRRRA